jgi:hypothetical protein
VAHEPVWQVDVSPGLDELSARARSALGRAGTPRETA